VAASMPSPPGNSVGGGGAVGGGAVGGGGVSNPANPQPGMPVQPSRPVQPVEPAAIMMLPPVAVVCMDPGPCECPAGTMAPCHITCDGNDACKDAAISCNNDGFPCSIDCIGMKACASSTFVGPVGSPLTASCLGEHSCEGNVNFNGQASTDVSITCNGMTSCKGTSRFNFGTGAASLGCHGDPDSCQGSRVVLPSNAIDTPGMAFMCQGLFCPANTPTPFSNLVGSAEVTCTGAGACSCPLGLQDTCTINCMGAAGGDACKDGLIECNNDGFDCFVNCMDFEGCSGSSVIMGPVGGSLTVQCVGDKSCEGGLSINGEVGRDLSVVCQGPEACKGNAQLNFGSGAGAVWCNGASDTCLGASFNLPVDAEITPGASFSCQGDFCPPNAPAPFSNVAASGAWNPRPPANNFPAPVPVPAPVPATPLFPGSAQFPAPSTPGRTPTIRVVEPVVLQPQPQPQPAVPAPPVVGPVVTPWCCVTSIANTVSWQGICWGRDSEQSCNEAPNGRCAWDETKCFQSPPICLMTEKRCTANEQCCSQSCRLIGTGSTCK